MVILSTRRITAITVKVTKAVDHSCGGEGFKSLERKFLDLSRHRRQFDDTDGQRQRGILEDRQKLACQRRDDDAVGIGQKNLSIDLYLGHADGAACLALAAAHGLDSRTDLFADTRGSIKADGDNGGGQCREGHVALDPARPVIW